MKALVCASAYFAQTPDGNLWTPNASLGYPFWTRYLDAYDEVHLLVQTQRHDAPPADHIQATGPCVAAAPLPRFLSPRLMIRNGRSVRRLIRAHLAEGSAIHLRIACFLSGVVWRALEAGRPYGVEVVTDPHDSFAPGAMRHPLREVLRRRLTRDTKAQCAGACAAAYVTRYALQRRYPPAPEAFATHFSSINLAASDFVEKPRETFGVNRRFQLVYVGTLAQLYKAPDVLLEAFHQCVRYGLDVYLTFVGDGQYRAALESRARVLGLHDRVRFRGQLSDRGEVQKELDAADLFVLPSLQEGLPRAMIEAMARALPCIGSTVGGIPELLPPRDLVKPGNSDALAHTIRAVLSSPQRMKEMSRRNLHEARDYEEGVLRTRRKEFYNYVREQTQAWHNGNAVY